MGKKLLFAAFLSATLFLSALAATADYWRSRQIYQVLTDRFARSDDSRDACADVSKYCGGTFVGLKNKLDYIASMGFDAIWISPVVENTDGGYHGYWASDIYQINKNFGTPQELKDLINAAHDKGIWVMVDVVANHVGPVGMDFSKINPFNSDSHYHSRCQINNWDNQTEVEYCRLADLPDLDQNNSYVRQTLLDWIKNLITEYGFDGIRIDTVPEIHPDFWAAFADAAGVYQIGEVFNGNYKYVANYQKYLNGTLNYPLYGQLYNIFGSRASMTNFKTHYENMEAFLDQFLLGNFVDNHDVPRFLHQFNDIRALKAALAFIYCTKGIPITYYGTEQLFNGGGADHVNREALWTSGYGETELTAYLRTLNHGRKHSGWYNHAMVERFVDDSFYAFTRCDMFFAFTNQPDQNQTRTITYHMYDDGDVLCDMWNSNDCVTVQNGKFDVTLINGAAKVLSLKGERLGKCSIGWNKKIAEKLFLSIE